MADITLERTLPHNLDAERSVLGAILIENRALDQAQEILVEEDFYREGHRKIFRVMAQLGGRRNAIDLITLKDELSREGGLESVGGAPYISSLLDGVPRSANVEHYARIVKEKSILRNLIGSANRILNRCFEAQDEATSLLDEAEKEIFALAETQMRSSFVHVREVAKPTLEYIDRVQQHQELITGVATGFDKIDEMTSGLQPTDLIIVAGRPSMGKTAFAVNVAQHAGTRLGKHVGVFSLEMSREQLFLRMLCGQARVDAHQLRTGRLGAGEWERLTPAFAELTEAPIYIDDTAGMSVFEMRAKARRLKAEKGLDLLVVDYLQLMRGRDRIENRNQEISEISRSLKALAKELAVPVIAVSQLSRAPEQRTGSHRPQLSDLRESGAIEQDADVVFLLFREEYYKQNDPDLVGRAEAIIAKQRNGPTGSVDLVFIRDYTKFENPVESFGPA
ncbi:MAG TPA: replicative DNA helicase [Verrucomicrobiae bacterium]|nr:replicative DNA helicase [Verrucomicrobiae bacterium]